jgi:hypothetical protein
MFLVVFIKSSFTRNAKIKFFRERVSPNLLLEILLNGRLRD